ncbi:MAG: DNA primase [Desulforhopalus sp.]|jgi:DNA primase
MMGSKDTWEDITARIKEQADIVQIIGEHVDLKRSGVRFLGLCPFHGEKTPSFSVHGGQQFFHCFGCGESGDVFSFVMKQQGLDFPESVRLLAEKYHIELPQRRRSKEDEERLKKREQLFKVNEMAAGYFSKYLKEADGAAPAREYLAKRGVSHEIQEKFCIGYAPDVDKVGWNFLGSKFKGSDHKAAIEVGLLVAKETGGSYDRFRDRIVFPIYNISGQVCGFGGRIVGEGQPKYLNSPESAVFNKSHSLLGLYQQKEQIRKLNRAIFVEGNFDLISLVANGCENVVAPLGTALTREQLRMVKRFTEEVTLFFDGDEAGGKAAARSVPFFLAEQITGKVAVLPLHHDPDTFVREKGLTALNALLDNAENLPEFVLGRWVQEYGLGLDGKRKIVEELKPLLAAAVSPLQRAVFLSHFAEKLGMQVNDLERHLEQKMIRTPPVEPRITRQKQYAGIETLSRMQKQLVEFMILNPGTYSVLAENKIRDCLEGSIGEILFLELGKIVAQDAEAEPEELLTVLPEGAERRFVSKLLLTAGEETDVEDGQSELELSVFVDFLKTDQLKRGSALIMRQIQQAQMDNNHQLLQELIMEKVRLDQKLDK